MRCQREWKAERERGKDVEEWSDWSDWRDECVEEGDEDVEGDGVGASGSGFGKEEE